VKSKRIEREKQVARDEARGRRGICENIRAK
jgi:hypothetical protein